LITRGKKEYRNVSKEAMDIGKKIHAWIEQKISGENPAIPKMKKSGMARLLLWISETAQSQVAGIREIGLFQKVWFSGDCRWDRPCGQGFGLI